MIHSVQVGYFLYFNTIAVYALTAHLVRHTGTTAYLPLNLFRVNDFSLLVDSAFSSGGFDPAGRDPRGGLPGRNVKGVCLVDFFQGETARFDEAARAGLARCDHCGSRGRTRSRCRHNQRRAHQRK